VALGEDALGLLDHDPRLQRLLELAVADRELMDQRIRAPIRLPGKVPHALTLTPALCL
jgi:hypothetical protein